MAAFWACRTCRVFRRLNPHVTLVTYDRRTIPPLLKAWAEADRHHGGVVFVDEKTIRTFDISGLARALRVLWHEAAKWDWTNRIYFLQS